MTAAFKRMRPDSGQDRLRWSHSTAHLYKPYKFGIVTGELFEKGYGGRMRWSERDELVATAQNSIRFWAVMYTRSPRESRTATASTAVAWTGEASSLKRSRTLVSSR